MTSVDICRLEENDQNGIHENGGMEATYGAPRRVDGDGLGVLEHLTEGDGTVARGQGFTGRCFVQNGQGAIDHGQQFLMDGRRFSSCSFEFNWMPSNWMKCKLKWKTVRRTGDHVDFDGDVLSSGEGAGRGFASAHAESGDGGRAACLRPMNDQSVREYANQVETGHLPQSSYDVAETQAAAARRINTRRPFISVVGDLQVVDRWANGNDPAPALLFHLYTPRHADNAVLS
jgi:hypothetical protein